MAKSILPYAIVALLSAAIAIGAITMTSPDIASLTAIQERRHLELLAHIKSLEDAIAASKPKRSTLLNVFLPIPGLGEVKFTAEVPTEDLMKITSLTNHLPPWLRFSSSQDTTGAANSQEGSAP